MPAKPRRIYLDANVLLAFVGNETGRAEVVTALMAEAGRGKVELLTSVLTITEVAYGGQERDEAFTDAALQNIEELWTPAAPIILVDMSQAVAREARSIIRDAKSSNVGRIGALDAIHLASARMYGFDDLLTYEDEPTRKRWATVTGLRVIEPITDVPQLDFESGSAS